MNTKRIITQSSPSLPSCCLTTLLSTLLLCVSCNREKNELVITDTAEVKRIEALKMVYEREKEDAKQKAARDERLAAQAREEATKEKQLEMDRLLAEQQLVREGELANQKKALADEVKSIATAKGTIPIFMADLRSRQGRLELKLKSLPEEIEQSKRDATYLSTLLSSCQQKIVTNIQYISTSGYYGTGGEGKIQKIQEVTLVPDDYVKAIKGDKKITAIMTRYSNDMYMFELQKVLNELAYEKKRISTSWEMLKKGRVSYDSKLLKANRGTSLTETELNQDFEKVQGRINLLKFKKNDLERKVVAIRERRLRKAKSGEADSSAEESPEEIELRNTQYELGYDGANPTGLYADTQRLKRMISLSGNTKLHGDAFSSGFDTTFALQEKMLRDEYEANVRRAFENVERTVLHVVTGRKDDLERELQSSRDELATIQMILDAHAKGRMSQQDILSLHAKYTNSISEKLSAAAEKILK